jgi:YD repeat-containing protein
VCDSAAPETVTTYQYGADGTAEILVLHGKAVSSGGTTLRTCYGYDAYSRKISETAPNANLATCP